MERSPRPNEIYRHFKGNLYRVITLAEHTETGEMLVVYQALYGDFRIYARPLEMFLSEVDHQKYPDVTDRYRFTLVPEIFGQRETDPEMIRPDTTAEPTEDVRNESGEEGEEALNLDPMLLEFLDADTYEEKLDIFARIHDRVTDDMLNTMAASLDLDLEAGELEERYQTLKNCLITLERYECNRLR